MAHTEEMKLILLVDDAPAKIRVAHEILKQYYKTRVAVSGAVALEALKIMPSPDLILLDVMMLEMDGFEVCTRLKADPHHPRDPCHLSDGDDMRAYFNCGRPSFHRDPRSIPSMRTTPGSEYNG